MSPLSVLSAPRVPRRTSRIVIVLRLFLGLIFTLAGINGFFLYFGLEPFLPKSPAAIELLGTGYLLVMEKSVELIFGLILLSGRFIPLTLMILFPITVNILAFHLFMDPNLVFPVIGMFLVHVYLLWTKKEHYMPLLAN
jgi:uncharacterized membrane protein YphA (DoxX/SURF4 family)